MADLAKLVVRLEAQSAQLLTELERANSRINRFASQTQKTLRRWSGGLVAAFSARAIIQFGNQVLQNADRLGDFAKQAGVSVESMSRLGYAAGQSGSDIESLNTGLGALSKTAVAAASGSKEAVEAFTAMGVEVRRTDGSLKSTDDLLLEIADSFSKHADGAEKSAVAQRVFSKSGKELIPLLNQGSAGIEELTARADALGITVSTQTQQAADDLNDTLATLGAITQGVVGRALAEVAPIFTEFAQSQIDAAEGSEKLDDSARVLAAGLRLLLSAGVLIGEIFDRVGSTLGAAAAALVAVAKGEFSLAWSIMDAEQEDFVASTQEAADRLAKIWEESGKNTVAAAKQTEEDLANAGSNRPSFVLPSMLPDMEEIEKHFKKLNDLTETDREKALRSAEEQVAALDKLAAARRITDQQYADRLVEINAARDAALGITEREEQAEERRQAVFDEGRAVYEATRTAAEEYEQTLLDLNLLLQQGAIDHDTYARAVEQAQDDLDKANGKMTDFAEQMRKNVQDILGQGLVDAFRGSADDILDTFFDMVDRMVAQALAAQIGEKLFGTPESAGKDGIGGLVGKGLGFLGSMFGFGGTRDAGGRGEPGVAYAIGRGAQPEVYVPDQPGTFYPRGEMPGGSGVTQNIYVRGEVNQRSARQIELESARRQRIANARLG